MLPLGLSPFSSPFLDKQADVEDEFRRVAKQEHKTFKVKFHSPPKQLAIRGGGKGLPHFAAEFDGSTMSTPPRADEADDEPLDAAVAADDAQSEAGAQGDE